ncbi:hypothetical protein Tco_1256107 [Tanacetum coccineum]
MGLKTQTTNQRTLDGGDEVDGVEVEVAAAVMMKMASVECCGSGGDGGGVAWWWQPVRGGDKEARGGACEGGSNRSEDGEHYWSWPEKSAGKVFPAAAWRWPEEGGGRRWGGRERKKMVELVDIVKKTLELGARGVE